MPNTTYEDFSNDILSAINFLKKQKYIDVNRIGLLSHGDGGISATIVATKMRDVSFMISLSIQGDDGEHITTKELCKVLRLSGDSEEKIKRDSALNRTIYNTIIHDTCWVNSKREYKKYLSDELNENTALSLLKDSIKQIILETNMQYMTELWKEDWFKLSLLTNSTDYLEKLTIPILAIFAEKDTQVDALPNSQKVEAALERAGNKNYKVVIIPNANHLFQVAETGLPNEYKTLKKEFEPSLLPTIVN